MMLSEVQSWLESSGFLQGFFQSFRTIVPATISSFDNSNNTATVSVSLQDINSAESPISGSSTLYEVPCLQFGGASNYVVCELASGDQGLLLVCDRDIDNYKAARGAAVVGSPGVANLKDSIFISGQFLPGAPGIKLASTTEVNVLCGSSSINITPDQITMQAGGATVQLIAGNIIVTGNLIINDVITFGTGGNVTGNLTIDGSITTTQDIVANGISLEHHVHGGVEEGCGQTGEPE